MSVSLLPLRTDAAPARLRVGAERPGVGVAPWHEVLPVFVLIAVPWTLLWAGRRLCLPAQRFPPAVWLVRAIYRCKEQRGRR